MNPRPVGKDRPARRACQNDTPRSKSLNLFSQSLWYTWCQLAAVVSSWIYLRTSSIVLHLHRKPVELNLKAKYINRCLRCVVPSCRGSLKLILSILVIGPWYEQTAFLGRRARAPLALKPCAPKPAAPVVSCPLGAPPLRCFGRHLEKKFNTLVNNIIVLSVYTLLMVNTNSCSVLT